MQNQLSKVSGEVKVYDLAEYKQICESEYLVKYNNLLDEYRDRKAGLEKVRDIKVEEYRLINSIVNINTMQIENKLNATDIIKIQSYLSEINYEKASNSFALGFWQKELGQDKAVLITCDIMSYFFRQFTVKENLDGAQMIQLTVSLFSHHSDLRLKQLIHCLNEAVLGKYGAFYERISISKVSEWISRYYEDIAANAETEYYRTKKTESRGIDAVDKFETELANFKKMTKAKKEIADAIYRSENRQKEIEQFKTSLENK